MKEMKEACSNTRPYGVDLPLKHQSSCSVITQHQEWSCGYVFRVLRDWFCDLVCQKWLPRAIMSE